MARQPSHPTGVVILIAILISVVTAIFLFSAVNTKKVKSTAHTVQVAEHAATHPSPAATSDKPGVVYSTTPATITADYEFNIESDGPLCVQYPGEKPLLYTPGKGFTQMPQPREAGAKNFTAPDSKGGCEKPDRDKEVRFRLYSVRDGR